MANGFHAKDYPIKSTSVVFKTADAELQSIYDKAEMLLKGNEIVYNDKRLIKEARAIPTYGLKLSRWAESTTPRETLR